MSSSNLLSKCKVAICQFTATNNKSSNFAIVKKLIENAKKEDAQIAFLPEACDYIASDKNEIYELAEDIEGPLVTEYRNVAKINKIWVSIGGFHEKCSENTIFNSHLLIDDLGDIKSIYRKIHLFDVELPDKNIFLRESDICKGGAEIVPPTKTPAGLLALAICYDLRFPEISLAQTKMGANILTYPSAFTAITGAAHWEILLRARAIENQCYVIAAAQYGQHNSKRTSYGHSLIIDPWGTIQAECPKYVEGIPNNQSIAFAEIDFNLLNKVKQEMPVQQHRRSDIYNLSLLPKSGLNINNDDYKFADKIIPSSTVFYQSKYCFAFTNIRCVVPGHVLVATLRCVPRLFDLSQEEVADLFQTVIKVQRIMEKEHNAGSSTICVQDGTLAGQTIPHVHVHVLPRRQNDFKNNDDIYLQLAKHDSENSAQPLRLLEEMVDEASKLKTYFNI